MKNMGLYKEVEEKFKKILESQNSNILEEAIDLLYKMFEKYNWIGIYIIKNNYLLLGPWRGEQATEHIRIPVGKGVCGSAAKTGKTEIVNDVNNDKRYLSCFVSTKSEIVVPIKKNDIIIGEIDIDSDYLESFDSKDKLLLDKIAKNKKFIESILNYDI
jgi:GAF domain-containing protein